MVWAPPPGMLNWIVPLVLLDSAWRRAQRSELGLVSSLVLVTRYVESNCRRSITSQSSRCGARPDFAWRRPNQCQIPFMMWPLSSVEPGANPRVPLGLLSEPAQSLPRIAETPLAFVHFYTEYPSNSSSQDRTTPRI